MVVLIEGHEDNPREKIEEVVLIEIMNNRTIQLLFKNRKKRQNHYGEC